MTHTNLRSLLWLVAALLGCSNKASEPSPAQQPNGSAAGSATTPPAPPPAPDPCRTKDVAGIAELAANGKVMALWSDGTRALALEADGVGILEWAGGCWRLVDTSPLPKSQAVVDRKGHLWVIAMDGRTAVQLGATASTWKIGDAPSTQIQVNGKITMEADHSFMWTPGWTVPDGDYVLSSLRVVWRNHEGKWQKAPVPETVVPATASAADDHAMRIHERAPGTLLVVWGYKVWRADIADDGKQDGYSRTVTWTPKPELEIKYAANEMWTSPDGITYLPERGTIHTFDGKRWSVSLADPNEDFEAVFPAGGSIWASGERTSAGHTHIADRDFYRLDKGKFVKVKSFPEDERQSMVHSPVQVGDVTFLRELYRMFVFEHGEWRVVTRTAPMPPGP